MGVLLVWLALFMPTAAECSELEAAHDGLLASSFSAERLFSVRLNGKLKMRRVTRLTYVDGELTKETVEQEVLDKNLVLEEHDGDSALDLPFACENVRRLETGRYELSSADGTEKVVFVRSERNPSILQPISWKNNEKKRFLWKKLVIEAVAEYRNFEWH